AYDRRAQEDVRRRIREELHEAVGLPGRQGPTDGGERNLPDSDLPTLGRRLGLLQPDGRDLGIGLDGRRQGAVVEFRGMSRDHLRSGEAFLRRLLGQERGPDDVADSVYVGIRGAQLAGGLDIPTRSELYLAL